MSTTTWLITGASRGLGFEFVRQLTTSGSHNLVFATAREPANAPKLTALAESLKSKSTGEKAELHVLKIDVDEESTIDEAAQAVKRVLEERSLRLDYLVNNAGASFASDTALTIQREPFLRTLSTNVLGPALVGQRFVPLMERTSSSAPSHPTVLVNVSSGLGSIGQNSAPGFASYSISKTALNMLTYKLAREKPGVIVFSIDPGWVRTDMGGPSAHLEIDFSVASMLKVITSATLEDTRTFKKYDGSILPW